MRVAIFGDSWGDVRPSFLLRKDEEPWPILLSKKYDITNFCESGSSFYFSTKNFLANYKNFDKVIFLVSDRTRRYLPEYSPINIAGGGPTRHIKFNTSTIVKDVMEDTKLNKEIILAIDLYYRYIANDEQDLYYHELTLNDIQSKLSPTKLLLVEDCFEIAIKEDRYYQKLGYDLSSFTDKKNCHMTYTNNKRMAELIDQWLTDPESVKLTINNTCSVNPNLFYDPVDEPFEKYYKKID